MSDSQPSFHADNSFARLFHLGWRIAETIRDWRNARPRRDPTQLEYGEWELGFKGLGAECRVLARRLGWDADKVAKCVEGATRLIIGLVRQGPDDPHQDDPQMWFIWTTNRFTAALLPIQDFALEYEAELRLARKPETPTAAPTPIPHPAPKETPDPPLESADPASTVNADRDQGGTKQSMGDSSDGSAETKRSEVLSDLQYDLLDALRILRATDPEKRATGAAAASKVGGDATEQSVKAPLADLKRRELVGSKTGRNGGSWLTPEGLSFINSLRPKQ